MREFITLVEQNLFELAEYIDRSHYGTWINADTKEIVSVPKSKHHDQIMRPIICKTDDITEEESYESYEFEDVYAWAFQRNWVRITHSYANFFALQGTESGIKKAWPLIRPSIMMMINEDGFVTVAADIYGGQLTINSSGYSQKFELPDEKPKLFGFIAGLTP